MEEIGKIILDNGLGVASFVALLMFIFKYEDKQSNLLNKISDTMIQIQITLATLTDRVDKIEDVINKKKEN